MMLTETLGRHETLNVFFTQPGASLHFPNLNDVVQASGVICCLQFKSAFKTATCLPSPVVQLSHRQPLLLQSELWGFLLFYLPAFVANVAVRVQWGHQLSFHSGVCTSLHEFFLSFLHECFGRGMMNSYDRALLLAALPTPRGTAAT